MCADVGRRRRSVRSTSVLSCPLSSAGGGEQLQDGRRSSPRPRSVGAASHGRVALLRELHTQQAHLLVVSVCRTSATLPCTLNVRASLAWPRLFLARSTTMEALVARYVSSAPFGQPPKRRDANETKTKSAREWNERSLPCSRVPACSFLPLAKLTQSLGRRKCCAARPVEHLRDERVMQHCCCRCFANSYRSQVRLSMIFVKSNLPAGAKTNTAQASNKMASSSSMSPPMLTHPAHEGLQRCGLGRQEPEGARNYEWSTGRRRGRRARRGLEENGT